MNYNTHAPTDWKMGTLKTLIKRAKKFYSNENLLKTEIEHLRKVTQDTAGNYMFKVNSRNTKTRCEICSKLIIKIQERRHCRRSGIFIINFEHISHFVLVLLLLFLSR